MAGYHVGAVMLAFDDRGVAPGAGFRLYDGDRTLLTLTFRDAEGARKGAALLQELVEIVIKIEA
jgi:hypothetical protein